MVESLSHLTISSFMYSINKTYIIWRGQIDNITMDRVRIHSDYKPKYPKLQGPSTQYKPFACHIPM